MGNAKVDVELAVPDMDTLPELLAAPPENADVKKTEYDAVLLGMLGSVTELLEDTDIGEIGAIAG